MACVRERVVSRGVAEYPGLAERDVDGVDVGGFGVVRHPLAAPAREVGEDDLLAEV